MGLSLREPSSVFELSCFKCLKHGLPQSGFNVCNRYLVVLYYQPTKAFKKVDTDKKKEEIEQMKAKFGLNDDE